MGQWETARGYGSDEMADILGEAFRNIAELRLGQQAQSPCLLDLADAIEFVSRGALVVGVHADAPRLGNDRAMDVADLDNAALFPTLMNRGQIR